MQSVTFTFIPVYTQVLLATAMIPIQNPITKQTILCRALLDSGAQVSMITEHCTQMLGLLKKPASLTIHGMGESGRTHSKSTTDLLLDCNPVIPVRAHVIKAVTRELPLAPVDCTTFRHMSNIKLADPTFGTPGKIDRLLHNEVYEHLMWEGKLKEINNPFLRETLFGWVVTGSIEKFLLTIPQARNQLHVTL